VRTLCAAKKKEKEFFALENTQPFLMLKEFFSSKKKRQKPNPYYGVVGLFMTD